MPAVCAALELIIPLPIIISLPVRGATRGCSETGKYVVGGHTTLIFLIRIILPARPSRLDLVQP